MAFDPLVFLPHLMAQPGVLASKLEENSYKGLATRRWQTTECNTAWPPFFFKTREIIIKFVIVLCFRQFFFGKCCQTAELHPNIIWSCVGFLPLSRGCQISRGFSTDAAAFMPHLNSTYSFSYYIPFLLPCVFQTFLPFSVYFFSFRLGFYVFDDYGPINVKTSLKHLLVARSLSQKGICMSCVPYVPMYSN